MLRRITFAKAIALAAIAGVLAVIIDVAIARARLPQTVCSVSDDQYRSLPLEVSYEKAKAILGCDGVLVRRETLPNLAYEAYAWHGTGWINTRVVVEFFGDSLKRKAMRSSLSVVYRARHTAAADDWQTKQALLKASRR
jgi:hypothetical protein